MIRLSAITTQKMLKKRYRIIKRLGNAQALYSTVSLVPNGDQTEQNLRRRQAQSTMQVQSKQLVVENAKNDAKLV